MGWSNNIKIPIPNKHKLFNFPALAADLKIFVRAKQTLATPREP